MALAGAQKHITTRRLLVMISLVAIGSFAGIIAVGNAVQSGAIGEDWMGILGLVMSGATICAAIVSFIHAARHDRNGPAWAIGSFLFPYAVPLVLAALPATGGIAVHGAEDSVALRSILAGKWICPCGIIRSDVHEGETCDDCGKPLLRFHPAEKNQTCSACGFHFSDVDVTTEDTMQEVWARKGFRCNACGENLCVNCSPIEATGELAFRCGCGGSLAIRV